MSPKEVERPAGCRSQLPANSRVNKLFRNSVNFFLTMRHVSEKAETMMSGKVWASSRMGPPESPGTYFLFGPKVGKTTAAFGQAAGAQALPQFCRDPAFRGETNMKRKIDIAAIPELGTSVGMHGSVKQKEVGGPLCLGVLVAIIMAL
jgi:hypothetical protein